MLIIDQKADYYDYMAYAYGIDKKVVFRRDVEETYFTPRNETEKRFLSVLSWNNANDPKFIDGSRIYTGTEKMFLVFCGVLHFIRRDYVTTEKSYPYSSETVSTYRYGFPVKKASDWLNSYWLEKYEEIKINPHVIINMGAGFQSPYFLITSTRDGYRIDLPNLKDIEFYKVMDANDCYQEIEMAVNRMKNVENNLVVVDNDVRIVQHGFDLKKSFRK